MEYPEELSLITLESAGVISSPERNLRSKIDSLLSSLENLSRKKIRIEYEIKKQKKSLARKRAELKKVSTSTQKKVSLVLESGIQNYDYLLEEEDYLNLRRIDSVLLEKSYQVLEEP